MHLRRILVIALSAFLAAPLAFPQGSSGVKGGKVYVSGENPGIRLLQKEGGPVLTNVNFWKVVYSPAGMGHVCYITSDVTGDGQSPDDVHAVFSDNDKLLDYLAKEIMVAFDKSYTEQPWPKQRATFQTSGDTLKEWKETIKSATVTIELIWRDFYEPYLQDTPTGGPRIPFGIASLLLPAKSAEVVINGKRAVGNAFPQTRGSRQSSTAFLAFSETWVK